MSAALRPLLVPALAFAFAFPLAVGSRPARADDAAPAPSPEALDNLAKAYPPAAAGKTRHVVLLPAVEGEENLKVEIVAGKSIDTDGVNRYRLGGEFREKDIPGWGFSFFEVDALSGPVSTRIAPAPGTPTEKRFVAGPSVLVRYNSRLPLVVYAPEGVEVRSRVWRAEGEPAPAEVR